MGAGRSVCAVGQQVAWVSSFWLTQLTLYLHVGFRACVQLPGGLPFEGREEGFALLVGTCNCR